MYLEAEFMFRRDKRHTLSSFIETDTKIDEEEPDTKDDEEEHYGYDEEDYKRPQLDPATQGYFVVYLVVFHSWYIVPLDLIARGENCVL